MRPLVVTVGTAGGRGRAALIAGCTAVVSGVLMVAAAMLRLGGEPVGYPRTTGLFAPLADPGTRSGTIFGVVLLTVPFLALLNQGVRLGTAARRRRYDALAILGATRADLRRWAAVEVGVPGAAGAVLGLGVYWLLRLGLGSWLESREIGALVPPHVGPGLWAVPVVLVVSALAAIAGAQSVRSSRRGRRTDRAFPVLWVVLLVAGASLLALATGGSTATSDRQLMTLPALVLTVSGLTGSAPWLTLTVAHAVGSRTSSAHWLLATRRLQLDPTSASRAGLATGAAGLAVGVCAALVAEVAHYRGPDRRAYTDPVLVVVALAGLAFLLVGVALAVHITDSVLAERRAYAALSATGFPDAQLVAALRSEAVIATLPIALTGCLLGGVGYASLAESSGAWLPWALAAVGATLAAAVASSYAAAALLAPVVRAATASAAIRTE